MLNYQKNLTGLIFLTDWGYLLFLTLRIEEHMELDLFVMTFGYCCPVKTCRNVTG